MIADGAAQHERTTTAELWVRSLGQIEAVEQQTELVDRLTRLEKAGILDGVDMGVWGGRLVLSGATARTAPGRRFLTRYQRFQDWADRAGATLEPFFETTEAVSSFTGEEHTLLVFPVHTLVEFDGDEVVHVAPSVVDGEVRSVEDRLAVLETRADEEAMTADGATVTAGTAATQGVPGNTEREPATAETDRTDDPERRVGDRTASLVNLEVRGNSRSSPMDR